MEAIHDVNIYSDLQAVRSLNVIIVGAGIAGLSTGLALSQYHHSVTILESSSKHTEVGAGIQLAPNATRILRRLGVLDQVMEHTSVLSGVSIRWASCAFFVWVFKGCLLIPSWYYSNVSRLILPHRRYDSDEELSYSPMFPASDNKYGAPMGTIHRGDLHRILLRAARASGCRILTSHKYVHSNRSK